MTNQMLSRRSFNKLVGAGAAVAALQPLDLTNASSRPFSTTNVVRLSSNENPY